VAARAAIARRYSLPGAPLTVDDVVIGSGCSGALDLVFTALLNEGQSVLIPLPGFGLYQTLCESKGVRALQYPLLPERGWEADLEAMERLIEPGKTVAVVVNNPSNPCGSVYSKEHLTAILELAERHRLVVIADEIYGHLTFGDAVFHPMASLTTTVPIVAVGGIAKEFLVPGWRVGWALVYDRHGALVNVREGLFRLTQTILGCNSLVQAVLPRILTPAPGSEDERELAAFHKHVSATLEANARFTCERLGKVPGLTVAVPQGAMYVMVRVDFDSLDGSIRNGAEFVQALLDEESVLVLPGKCFGVDSFFRIVYTAPHEVLAKAYERIEAFCLRHQRSPPSEEE
jgi:tyrosine aminotransferase